MVECLYTSTYLSRLFAALYSWKKSVPGTWAPLVKRCRRREFFHTAAAMKY